MFKLTRKTFYIILFSILWLITAFSSFFHAVEFFELSNVTWMGIILALAFEIGQASVLMSILTSPQDRKKYTPWILMCILTLVQIIGNVYSSYKYIMLNSPENLKYFKEPIFIWTDLPDAEATVIITYVSAAILPIVALLMTSMITNYLTDQSEENNKPLIDEIDEVDGPPEGEGLNEQQEINNLNVALDKKDEEIDNLKNKLEKLKNDQEKENSQQGLPESNVELTRTTEVQRTDGTGGETTTTEDKSDNNDGRCPMVSTEDQKGTQDTTPEDSKQENNEVHTESNEGNPQEIHEDKIDENKIDESEQYKLDNEGQDSLEISDGQTEDTITEDVQAIEEEPKKPSHFINL